MQLEIPNMSSRVDPERALSEPVSLAHVPLSAAETSSMTSDCSAEDKA
jgi:hypothetical protein